MIVTRRIGLRIALIVFVAVVLQLAFLSYLSILGATPHLLPVVTVALGLLGGSMVGAVCGFATGLLVDSALLQPLGVTSLVLLSVGYLAGRYREGFEISSSLTPPLLTGGFVLLGGAAFAALQLLLGVETPVSLLVLREVVVQALLAIVLAVPVYPLVRRVLRAALIEDLPPRRVLMPASVRRRRSSAARGRTARVTAAARPSRVTGTRPSRVGRRSSVPAGRIGR
ncbi:MAG TPA: rod shape-determining protein MreD [Solirubrobacterales bacterium]|nr:rod shape-determining protein MreD [Solirubrobacterales bacterium]